MTATAATAAATAAASDGAGMRCKGYNSAIIATSVRKSSAVGIAFLLFFSGCLGFGDDKDIDSQNLNLEDTEKESGSETLDYNMTVIQILDGDTFDLGNGDRVRMLGINTPESGRPYSEEATEALTTMILGKEIALVNDSKNEDMDSYGRLLGHVYVGPTLVNYELIRTGMAFWYPYSSGTDMDGLYEEAQESAASDSVGLWTQSPYNMTIDYIEYDPDGDEADGEYLIITNHESYNVSMEGWYQGIWNNGGDMAIVQDENGLMVDYYRYGYD